MSLDLSPAAERAVAAAGTAGPARTPAAALLAGLFADEDGRPAELVRAAGGDPARLAAAPPAGPTTLAAVLDALRARAEGSVTSEHLLAALIRTAPEARRLVEAAGASADRLLDAIDGPPPAPVALDESLALATPADTIDAARVIDANANRAREALRAVEDYVRFVLDDGVLTAEAKAVRHGLAAALGLLPDGLLTASRDTAGDVGTTVTAAGEGVRHTPAHVALVNLKRLQEALRSLEEYGKCFDPAFGREVERLRYRSYTLEKAAAAGADARARLEHARLYVLLGGADCAAALDWTIAEAAGGGADVVQLREKNLDDRRLLDRARQVREWTRRAGVLFIVNDRPDIARLCGADGVHLGQDDLPVREARRVLGADAIIGVSTHTVEQVRQAVLDGATYLGVGPTFPSTTKSFDRLAGVEFVRAALAETTLPAFVLGGINAETITQAVAAGARRVAVSAAVARADDPRQAAAGLRAALGR